MQFKVNQKSSLQYMERSKQIGKISVLQTSQVTNCKV